tara:strand:+ start:124 stop:579 length:456 start_codon:yes stop_codon:yes gene_type:complete
MELDSFSVDTFIQRLPQDIINSIIPYTYQPQSETLLKDIRNYSKTINLIRNLYYQYWTVYKGYSEIEGKWQLINDIERYANNDIPTMLSFIDKFRHIWFRNFTLNNNDEFDNFIEKFVLKSTPTQINMFWGILIPQERHEFIDKIFNEFLQ